MALEVCVRACPPRFFVCENIYFAMLLFFQSVYFHPSVPLASTNATLGAASSAGGGGTTPWECSGARPAGGVCVGGHGNRPAKVKTKVQAKANS